MCTFSIFLKTVLLSHIIIKNKCVWDFSVHHLLVPFSQIPSLLDWWQKNIISYPEQEDNLHNLVHVCEISILEETKKMCIQSFIVQ